MAWGGLITGNNGKFWDEFFGHNPDQADRDRIMDTIQDEANSTNNSSGNGNDCE